MGKYTTFERKQPPRLRDPHPIWRGFGCIMILIVPAFSYAVSVLLISYGRENNWPIPPGLLGNPQIPEILFRIPGLVPVWAYIESLTDLYAYLALAAVITLMLAGVLSLFYAILYRFIGPPQYGPLDAPPAGIKVKRYKR